jgi:hypothetical protein
MDLAPDALLLRKSGSTVNRTRDLWICSLGTVTTRPQNIIETLWKWGVELRQRSHSHVLDPSDTIASKFLKSWQIPLQRNSPNLEILILSVVLWVYSGGGWGVQERRQWRTELSAHMNNASGLCAVAALRATEVHSHTEERPQSRGCES